MAQKKFSTTTPGVRYRAHVTRKHGVKFDRYYSIRYRFNGKLKEEGLGWASEGWTERKAGAVLAELKGNQTTGSGPHTLAEKRQHKAEADREKATLEQVDKIKNMTFDEVMEPYLEYCKLNRKTDSGYKREEQLYRLHIQPVLIKSPLRKVSQIQLEKIKKNMTSAGKSARTIRYALATVRQVFNFATRQGFYSGPNPALNSKVSRPQEDNTKTRYLTKEECDLLLKELAKKSIDIHDMALMSLYTGMRFSEVAGLRWDDVDLFQGVIMITNTKSRKNRPAYVTSEVKKMLSGRGQGEPEGLIFPPARGDRKKPRPLIGNTYYNTVNILFNKDLTDKKLRVDFHTLRHTFASWLVEKGTDLYLIKELLGHSDLKVTERYAHIGDNQLRQAVMKLQR